MKMAKVKITQIKSRIGASKVQKANLDALGLRKIRQTVEHNATAQILGMVDKVKHLIILEQVEIKKPVKSEKKDESQQS